MKILIIDDEEKLVKGISYNLESEGYQVVTGSNGLEALRLAQDPEVRLIVLDVMMPVMDGLEACRRIRQFSDVPIIMLTAKTEDMDKLLGFDCGADDYLTKPFNILELKARIRAILKRTAQIEKDTRIVRGSITLDSRSRNTYKNGVQVELTAKEFDLVELLIRNPNRVYSRENLLDIISRSDSKAGRFLLGSQSRYAAAYILIITVVLMFLNIYAPISLRRLTFTAKRHAIIDKAQFIVSALSGNTKLNNVNVSEAMENMADLDTARILLTDADARCIYDTRADSARGQYVFFPEITEALEGNDAVYVRWDEEQIVTRAAVPIVSYNRTIGAVYLVERDPDQAILIANIQRTILWISVAMEVLVILFSILFSVFFSRRMGKLVDSVQKMHSGDYSVRLSERGRDEVARLSIAFNHLGQRLHQSEEVRKQFVSNASHELKTPLASIKLLTDSILQNDMDQATMREFVADVGDEAERLNRISQKLLELTRLDTQPVEERNPVAVATVADRVLRRLTPVARKNSIRLDLDAAEDATILATEDDLYQILFNLTENGIKYNWDNGSVTVRVHRVAENVIISVEDTGVGIPDAEKPYVFDRFYRVDKARSRKAGGAGLGLSIVADMVARNDGSVSVTDGPKGGSCFRLSFPAYLKSEEASS